MQKRLCLMLALLSMTVLRAWADSTFGGGDGSVKNPYIINTAAHWDQLASDVNGGNSYSDKYFLLDADITVTKMVGTDGHKFKGHFDGGNKTLTLSYGTVESPFGEDYCAPFRYIEDADIHNLTVDGTIYTKNMFTASIAASALNDNAITNCLSSVVINSSVSGGGTNGGFVANCQNNVDHRTAVTFTNCAFNGQLIGTNTNNWGGFVGWEESNDWAAVEFTNCLFAPSEMNVNVDISFFYGAGDKIVAADNSTAFKGNGNTIGTGAEKYLDLLSKKDEQIDRLITLIEKLKL